MNAGPSRRARVLAPAKINLFLELLAKRPDGFHELETAMLALDLCDEVEAVAVARPGVEITVLGPAASTDVPTDATNLAVRAALACLDAARRAGAVDAETGLDLRLEKRIPSQAGLGGGSSDAAAAWLAAEAALAFEAAPDVRRAAMARLGSDCAFFLEAAATGFARCHGRGERVEPLPFAPSARSLALVVPAVAAPTALVYRHALVPDAPRRLVDADPWREPFNRLEEAALRAIPALAHWRAALDAGGARAFVLSGSGSAFFAACASADESQELLERARTVARRTGLALRDARIASPSGHGAKLLLDS